jgi:hypothetical protein
MSRPLITAFVAVFGLSTLAGCHHFNNSAPVYTPVSEAPPPATQPSYSSKFR